MLCKQCNAELDAGAVTCGNCGAPVEASPAPAKKPCPVGLRILLGFLSVLLSLALFVGVMSTAAILDLRLLTHRDSLEKVVTQLISAPAAPRRHLPAPAARGMILRSESAPAAGQTQEQLVEWLYDTLKDQYGDELAVTQEQMQTFLDQSSTKDYLTDKIVSYMDDFVSGTENTTITSQEITDLIEENKDLIESQFGVEVNDEVKDIVTTYVEEAKLDEVIRTEVFDTVESIALTGSDQEDPNAYTVAHLLEDLRDATSTSVLLTTLGICLLLVVLLFFTNRMRIPGTLCCAGIPTLLAGLLLSLPIMLLRGLAGTDPVLGTVSILTGILAPVHYGTLALGAVLIVAAIVTKAVLRPKKA